jgi:hypothetical protein
MSTFSIGQESDGRFVLDKPQFNNDGWLESYRLRLISDDFNLETNVDNVPYGEMLSDYLAGLAQHWQGWEGEKAWRAIEDEYRISAVMSKTGHVTLTVTINMHQYQWRAIVEFMVEAGQLEELARHSKSFFGT